MGLAVNNPNNDEVVELRNPIEIIDELIEIDKETKKYLDEIRTFL